VLFLVSPESFILYFFGCYAATGQLALQLHQQRTQVVCSIREARKRPAREHSPQWTLDLKAYANTICLRVEFLLKIDSGYPKDTGVALFALATWELFVTKLRPKEQTPHEQQHTNRFVRGTHSERNCFLKGSCGDF